MTNAETERLAIEYVLAMEREAGRQPRDVRRQGVPFDISSPPRKIDVKSFGRSARGDVVALEHRQFQAAREDPGHYYIYAVDNVSGVDGAKIAVRVLHGAILSELLDRAVANITYWPTLRTADYDRISEGVE